MPPEKMGFEAAGSEGERRAGGQGRTEVSESEESAQAMLGEFVWVKRDVFVLL